MQMAKKRKNPRKTTPAAKVETTASSGEGPVTLAEAEELAQAQMAKRVRRRTTAVVPMDVSLEAVGEKRSEYEQQSRDEIAQRVREYTATMSIMKQRGVKGLVAAGAPKRRRPAATAPGTRPLQILAEGDSWFDYPYPSLFFGGGVIKRLTKRLGVPILNLAKAGDEARNMLGVEQRERLTQHLENGCPAGGDWDVLLFSGGGNDIVGNPMALWINDYKSGLSPARLINQPRFDAALSLVRAAYEDLIGLRDSLSPGTRLVFHAYDFAIPDGRGVCHLGPWLKPTFDLHAFPSQTAAFNVVKAMLKQFATMLRSLERNHGAVTFINTQGTLAVRTSSWHNELHPSKSGFNQITQVFYHKLKSLYPRNVV
jgi:hypothetical protein